MLDGFEFEGLNEEEVVKRLMEMSDADLPPISGLPTSSQADAPQADAAPVSSVPVADGTPQEMFTRVDRGESQQPVAPPTPFPDIKFEEMTNDEAAQFSNGESDTDILKDIRDSLRNIENTLQRWDT